MNRQKKYLKKIWLRNIQNEDRHQTTDAESSDNIRAYNIHIEENQRQTENPEGNQKG